MRKVPLLRVLIRTCLSYACTTLKEGADHMGKRILCAVLAVVCLLGLLPVFAKAAEANIDIAAPSAILMDAATGTILFEKNDKKLLTT